MLLSFEQALAVVKDKLSAAKPCPAVQTVPLTASRGRVLAEDVRTDRDYPPFHRSTRDGYALRAADVAQIPATLECLGELRAGESFARRVESGQCVQIMTGAPLPAGTDAVVMVEYTRADKNSVHVERSVVADENVVRQGSEAAAGTVVLRRGRRLVAGEIGLMASVGKAQVPVFARPGVAILPTGDEVVPVEARPEWFQIRNSNALTLAAQVEKAGGAARVLPIARDEKAALRELILEGLKSDLLLLSGGISAGKYDHVAPVLQELGAEFYFQGVAIRPGKPLTFGCVRDKFFFALPGNPVSTYVTFELFARAALEMLSGADFEPPVFLRARLAKPFRQRHGLTAFMPARVEIRDGDPTVELVGWQGSGDLVGVAAANCFLVVHPAQTDLAAGDWVDVLPKPA
ncbi:MAG: gephyrin-like molybdotransferase Glp [Terriglobia bacterium]